MSITKIDSITGKSLFPKKFPFKDHIGRDIYAIKGQVFQYTEIKGKYSEQNGPTIVLKGAFVAVNLITGEAFESGSYLPPKDIGNQAKNRMDAGEVSFDVEVKMGLATSDKNEQGYAWVTTPIMDSASIARHEAIKTAFVAAMVPLIGANTAKPSPKR